MLELSDITFGYESSEVVLFEALSARFPPGWTGIIGANGAGKTTLLELAAGRLAPWAGVVRGPGSAAVCPQRTDEPPAALAEIAAAPDREALLWCGRLDVDPADAIARWATLSHGERKRAQIAAALARAPRVLALDEPTNHIDGAARALLIGALREFRGVGLLVSHDRAMLDTLCGQCLFLRGGAALVCRGGYTEAKAQLDAEDERTRRAREQAKREQKKLRQATSLRRAEADRADARRSKSKVGRKDRDAKARINAARVSGKDGQAGRLKAQLDGRLRHAGARVDALLVTKRRELGMTMRGEAARCDTLLRLEAGAIPVGPRALRHGELVVRPGDRVGVSGPNGGGKSTLVAHVVGRLSLPPARLVYLPQEVTAADGAAALDACRGMPHDVQGDVLAAVACLGSEPDRLLASRRPSPGETRKLLLALGLARRPHLIVMDEPTNHLDLPSIECVQGALASCACALLLVSHDEVFLQATTRTRWRIVDEALIVA